MSATHEKNELGEPPCDECRMRVICAAANLACKAFVAYCDEKPWKSVAREPTFAIYDQVHRQLSIEEEEAQECEALMIREAKIAAMQATGRRPGRRPKAREVACA